MSNGWIDISECTEGYWLFVADGDDNDFPNAYPVEVDRYRQVYEIDNKKGTPSVCMAGKAMKLCDINNNGEVLVEAKNG